MFRDRREVEVAVFRLDSLRVFTLNDLQGPVSASILLGQRLIEVERVISVAKLATILLSTPLLLFDSRALLPRQALYKRKLILSRSASDL